MSVYAAADWHGCYWIWVKVKQILKPNDKLYFLGDAADRGPAGWQIMKELLTDSRVIYLKGNHEDVMLKVLYYSNVDNKKDYWYWNQDLETWYWNGGEITHNAFNKDTDEETKVKIIQKLKNLPFCALYHNTLEQDIFLSHAGCIDFDIIEKWDEEHFIWDRTHWLFADEWNGTDNQLIIHGHTPIELMIKEQNQWMHSFHKDEVTYSGHGSQWYAGGHKINIDTGAVWSGEAVLLNLDTLDEIIIKEI